MPEALINFVALLGWAPSNSAQELFTMQQLIDAVGFVSFRSSCALSVSFIVCVCLLVHFICVLIVLAGLGAHAAAPLCVINPHTRFDTFYFPPLFLFLCAFAQDFIVFTICTVLAGESAQGGCRGGFCEAHVDE